MQAGFSNMNDLTVLQASQGLATYVKENVTNASARGVVIGYDHRHNSRRFATLTALAFKHLKFEKVYLFSELVHTPLVPFSVMELNAACGVMITASHNPAQDNGYKVYWSNGCQIIPPLDSEIAKAIENNLKPWTWDTSVVEEDSETTLEMAMKYYKKVEEKLIGAHFKEKIKDSESLKSDLKFVYTAMHGVGNRSFMKIASLLGLSDYIIPVEEQQTPDPDFPTVKFPNPEEKGALDLAEVLADKVGSSIVLANDPDADRFAVAVKSKEGNWVQITGNQLGALFAYHVLKKYKSCKEQSRKNPKGLALLNSTVSSQLMKSMAEIENFHYEDTLTGFKWIGNRAQDLVEEGYDVPFAYEEAIGYMFPVVFDKDGISAATIFLQMAVEWHTKGITPLEELEEIYSKYGYFAEYNSYYIAKEPELITEIFNKIRTKDAVNAQGFKQEPAQIGPEFKVVSWRDLTIGYDSKTEDHKPILPVSSSSQMITVELVPINPHSSSEKIRFTARGSGTEPKLKVYIEAKSDSETRSAELARRVWDLLATEWFSELS